MHIKVIWVADTRLCRSEVQGQGLAGPAAVPFSSPRRQKGPKWLPGLAQVHCEHQLPVTLSAFETPSGDTMTTIYAKDSAWLLQNGQHLVPY